MTKALGVAAARGDPLEALRLQLRVPVFTAACVYLGVGAHIAAGGSLAGDCDALAPTGPTWFSRFADPRS